MMEKELYKLKADVLDFIGWIHLNQLNKQLKLNQSFTKSTDRYSKYDCTRDQDNALIEIKINTTNHGYDQIKADDFYYLINQPNPARLMIVQSDSTRIYDLKKIYSNKDFEYTIENRNKMGSDSTSPIETTKLIYIPVEVINKEGHTVLLHGTFHSIGEFASTILNRIKRCSSVEELNKIYNQYKLKYPQYEFNTN